MRNSVYTIGNLIMSVMGHICECGVSERMIEKRKQIVILNALKQPKFQLLLRLWNRPEQRAQDRMIDSTISFEIRREKMQAEKSYLFFLSPPPTETKQNSFSYLGIFPAKPNSAWISLWCQNFYAHLYYQFAALGFWKRRNFQRSSIRLSRQNHVVCV